MDARRHRAGEPVDDLCRACKALRRHTVMVAGAEGEILRVVCDYCGSEHHYRHGGDAERPRSLGAPRLAPARPESEAFPLVSERERSQSPVSLDDTADLELLRRRVIRAEAGRTAVGPAAKWRGGQLVLRPGNPDLQEKAWPIESIFHKIVMIRNRLRTLEQQLNGAELPEDLKLKLQGYVTGCYGSLTSFNVLFAEPDDQFKGAGGE